MENFKTNYKDYKNYAVIMISTDRQIWNDKSAVRERIIEYSKLYKELHVIIFSTKKIEKTELVPNLWVYSTNSFVRWNYVSDAIRVGKRILKGIEKTLPILVSCQDPFETGLAGKNIANQRNNSELLLQIHTDLFSPYFTKHSFLNSIRLFISKFTFPHAQVVRVVSNKIANSLVSKGYNKEKIIVKPINIQVDKLINSNIAFNLKEKYPEFKKIVLMVSRLESEKNIEMALRAWKITTDRISDAGLIIVGSGKEQGKLKKLAYKLKIDSRVVFVGWQSDLVPYYRGCDIFLNTSWYEGYGMVFKEAQALGCKIVSTDVGIARDVGAEIAPWNEEKIAEILMKILNQ